MSDLKEKLRCFILIIIIIGASYTLIVKIRKAQSIESARTARIIEIEKRISQIEGYLQK